jgi:hypothetical protein
MSLVLIVLIIVLLLGGGWGYSYGGWSGYGPGGLVGLLVIVLLIWLPGWWAALSALVAIQFRGQSERAA